MATVGLNAQFKFGSNGTPSTEVDNSTKTKSVTVDREQDLPDVTAFGSSGVRSVAAGLSGWTVKAEFFWDATIEAQLNNLINYTTAVNCTVGPDGTTSGYPKYTGTFFLKSLGVPVTIGDVKVCSAEFTGTGALTRTTY